MMRILLFLATNMAVLIIASITLKLPGCGPLHRAELRQPSGLLRRVRLLPAR